MSDFIYYPASANSGSSISQSTLKHHYFSQLSPDGGRLVEGVLQQGERPPTGRWIDVGNVNREFSRRYFVQYTNFNTLVPGSLIESNHLPKGKWKEIKKNAAGSGNFYRVNFPSPEYTVGAIGGATNFVGNGVFIQNIMIPAIEAVHPDIVIDGGNVLIADFFDFKGTFDSLDGDTTKLTLFDGNADFDIAYIFGGNKSYLSTNEGGSYNLQALPSITNGLYSFIMAFWTEPSVYTEYIVLENILLKHS